LRNGWITKTVLVKIEDADLLSMLHLALAEIMQIRSPMAVLGQVIDQMLGQ